MVREPCDRAVITANQNVIATVVRGEVWSVWLNMTETRKLQSAELQVTSDTGLFAKRRSKAIDFGAFMALDSIDDIRE